jgi:hypothetical protein
MSNDELLAKLEEVERELDAVTFAAHMPEDYEYGLPSWICQRLYWAYIHQGKNKGHWDALKTALNERDAARTALEAAEKENAELALENVGLAATLKLKYESELEAARGMAEILTQIEWVEDDCHFNCCPVCGNSCGTGHHKDCDLSKALTAWRAASNTSAESADTNNKGESK